MQPGTVIETAPGKMAIVVATRDDRIVIVPLRERSANTTRLRGDEWLRGSDIGLHPAMMLIARCADARVIFSKNARLLGLIGGFLSTRLGVSVRRCVEAMAAESGQPFPVRNLERKQGELGRRIGRKYG